MTLLFIGAFLLGFGTIVLVLTGGLTGIPLFTWLCVPTMIVPGLVLVLWGVVAWRKERRLEEFAAWLKSYRREKMDVLAQRLGQSRFEFEKLLGLAIEKGLVSGVVDRAHDEFVLQGGEAPSVFVGTCPWCGGDVNKWAFPEEVWTCPYCERSVTTPVVPLEASPVGPSPRGSA